nr:protein kinase [Acidimicrobiia bacterium]
KVIKPEYANHPEFIRRFEAEAQLVARLEHPHIVPLYDYWREPGGAYLVMRWLDAGTVADAVERGPWHLDATGRMLEQVGAALGAAHRAGVVHRDLKPANVLLDRDGNAYLSDFGIAKDLGAEATETIGIPGSPAYMAPEQLEDGEITPRTDQYALGLVLYEVLTGRRAHEAGSVGATVTRQLHEPLPSVHEQRPDVPAGVDDVLTRATAKNAAARYSDVFELMGAFRRAAGDEAPQRVAVSTANPYKGLRAFHEPDARDFFGRDDLTAVLSARLRGPEERFLAVVGPSGSGKSSVVRAGLVPALRRGAVAGSEGWFIAEMLPGNRPFEELEAALLRVAVNPPPSLLEQLTADASGIRRAVRRVLPDDGSELLLLIDQFEELFTIADSADERDLFVESLVAGLVDERSRLRVIVTLRADFYDRPLMYGDFGRLVKQRQETVLPLSPEELTAAITGPAQRVGVAIDTGVVSEMVASVTDQPGALPLLQYALTELFDHRRNEVVTHEAYDEIGGVLGALGRRAEEIFGGLDDAGREAARQLFLRLVTMGEGVEDTRRRVPRKELVQLGDPGAMERVIDEYGRFRLLSFDRDPATRSPTVEVAHEALLREWPRYRAWIDESRDDMRLYRRVAAMAAEWESSDRDRGFLMTGSRLAETEQWSASSGIALSEAERAFLTASLERRAEEQAAEYERRRHEAELEQRAARRRNAAIGILAIAVVIAVVLGGFALVQMWSANEQLAINEAGNLAQEAVALAELDPDLALERALEAVQRTSEVIPEAEAALRDVLNRWRRVLVLDIGGTAVALDGDGSRLFAGFGDGSVQVIDAVTGEVLNVLTGEHSASVLDIVVTHDGLRAITSDSDGVVAVWNLASGDAFAERLGTTAAGGLATTVEGNRVAVAFAGPDPQVRIYELLEDAFEEVAGVPGIMHSSREAPAAAFDDSGSAIAIPRGFSETWLTELGSDSRVELDDASTGSHQVGWVDDILVSAGSDGLVRAWTVRPDLSADVQYRLDDHSDAVTSLDLRAMLSDTATPDLRLITGSADGTARLWEGRSGDLIAVLGGHDGSVVQVALSTDGSRAVTLAETGRVRVWEATTAAGSEWLTVHGVESFLGVAVDPRGELVVTTDGQTAVLRNAVTGEPVRELLWDGERVGDSVKETKPGPVAWSGDGSTIAVKGALAARLFGRDGSPKLEVWECGGFCTGLETERSRIVVSADGSLVVAAEGTGSMVAYRDGDATPLPLQDAFVRAVDLHPLEPIVATGSESGSLRTWSLDGEQIGSSLEIGVAISDVRFDPSGEALLVVAADRRIRMYPFDVTGGLGSAMWSDERTHEGAINVGVFDPSGVRFLTAGDDGKTIIWAWDGDRATVETVLEGHAGAVTDAAWWPDGMRVITSSSDRTVRVHALAIDDLVRLAEERAR